MKDQTGRDWTVLVVDDEEGLNRHICRKLKSEGFTTDSTFDGAGAVAKVAANPNTLLLLDCVLPDMTGSLVIAKLREAELDVPVVAMIGHGDEQTAIEMMKLGARDYVVKQVDFAETLPDKVRRIIAAVETERRLAEAEETVRTERDRAQGYLDLAGVMFVALDAKGRITLLNRRACEVLGCNEQEMPGKNWFDHFIPERMRDEVKTVAARLAAGEIKPMKHFENPVVTKSGEERFIAWHNTFLRDAEGNITGTLSSGEDITEHKRAEDALRESEERFRFTFDNVTDVVYSVDRRFRITNVTPSVERLLGYKPEELIGKSFRKLNVLALKSMPRALRNTLMVLSGKRIDSAEYEFIAKDGTHRFGEVSGAPLRDARDKVVGIVSVARDVTDRKLAEAELRKHRDHLEELVEERTGELKRTQADLVLHERFSALGKVAGTIAHEIRNPLGSIRNASYFLNITEGANLSAKGIRHLEIINEEIEHSNHIITSLLDFAQGRKTRRLKCRLADIIEQSLDHARLPAGRRIVLDVPADLPPVLVDEVQVGRALTNLLTNAHQALPEDGSITVTARPVKGFISVEVSDNGPGIEPETATRIFEPLFSTKAVGTGLGLTICKTYVEANDGTVELTSTSSKGTTFTITLPTD